MTTWRLMTWALGGGRQKSAREVTRLVRDVIQAPDFDPEELAGFDAQTATTHLDAAQKSLPPDDPFSRDQWKRTSVDILIPTREKNRAGNGQKFTIDGFCYRPILDVIRAVFAHLSAKWFHLTPFRKVSCCTLIYIANTDITEGLAESQHGRRTTYLRRTLHNQCME